jgi:K+-sensing histidine kinase KdpD
MFPDGAGDGRGRTTRRPPSGRLCVVDRTTVRLTARALGVLVGVSGVALVTVVFLALGSSVPETVPALLLLVPIVGAAVFADWKVALPVAVLAAVAYSVSFLPPTGTFSIGLTQDVFMAVTFVAVAVGVSIVVSRRSRHRRETLLDEQRMRLVRTIAHDLRNPLNVIRAVSTDLLDNGFEHGIYDEAAQMRLLALVRDESERLDRIVGNLLSLSRVQAGAFVPAQEPESVAVLVERSIKRLERMANNPIVAVLDEPLPEVLVDGVQIDQVLVNLVENALRHSPPDAPVEVHAHLDGSFVVLSVDDSGAGFSAAATATLFQTFQSDQGSSGLGLSVCHAIVEAHGGTIAVGVSASGGARVSFRLPVAP